MNIQHDIDQRAQKLLHAGTINQYAIGLVGGALCSSMMNQLLASAILEVALAGNGQSSRIVLNGETWVLWTDGRNSAALSTTTGSVHSKSAYRALRRLVRHLIRAQMTQSSVYAQPMGNVA